MAIDLNDRACVITGATTGIGEALARAGLLAGAPA
jgi:NAD(P)-dependent dehydrogenase (short-subunit alcohol dehydrogenase family)